MTREEYISLYEKRIAGTCSPVELERLEAFEKEQEGDLWWDEAVMGDKQGVKQMLTQQLARDLQMELSERRRFPIWMRAAAAIVLLGMGFLGWFSLQKREKIIPSMAIGTTVKPGANKAKLYVGNGSAVELDGQEKGLLLKQANVEVISAAAGELIYRFSDEEISANQSEVWSALETPKGGQYQLTLPDGSKVWLNAASSLRFSNRFNQVERLVELNGEAYFEIAKSSRPFKVRANGTEVAVLGTHFNVSAYKDDAETKTTLLEGAVKVSYHTINQILKPGQQAVVLKEAKRMELQQVDTEEAVAWHKGYFIFQNEEIQRVMRKVQRWYDVEVVFSPDVTDYQFSGTISRYGDIKEILNMFELTGIVHFKMEGRRITVMK